MQLVYFLGRLGAEGVVGCGLCLVEGKKRVIDGLAVIKGLIDI